MADAEAPPATEAVSAKDKAIHAEQAAVAKAKAFEKRLVAAAAPSSQRTGETKTRGRRAVSECKSLVVLSDVCALLGIASSLQARGRLFAQHRRR